MTKPIIVYPDADTGEADAHAIHLNRLREIGELRLFTGRPKTHREYVERVRDANAILLGWDLPHDVMLEIPKLEVVSFTGIGASKFVDISLAQTRTVTVCNCPGYSDNTVAEHALALLLAAARRLPQLDSELRAGRWNQQTSGQELKGKRIGLVGFGGIAARFAEICAGLGMEVWAWTRKVTAERRALDHVKFVGLDDLYSSSNFISLHLASNNDTEGFIDARALAAMKADTIFINTARAELVDEAALLAALEGGSLKMAALDVYWEEPLGANHPLLLLDNVIVTPHIAFKTPEATSSLFAIGVNNIVQYFAGQPINIVS